MKKNVNIINHPLIKHKMTLLRDKNTSSKDFRALLSEVGMLLTYEICKKLKLKSVLLSTPLKETKGYTLKNNIVIVPILRAGLGMVDGILNVLPAAKVGHIGLYRNENSLTPVTYYAKFPDCIASSTVILVDPMLATGNSCVKAISILKEKGVKEIIYVGLVGVQEGIDNILKNHPDVKITLAALDPILNEKGYIEPGLGDCGDRLFGTK